MSLPIPPAPLAAVGAVVALAGLVVMLSRSARRKGTARGGGEQEPGRSETLVEGHLTLRDGARFPAGIRLNGDLRVEKKARVNGPIRVTGDAAVEDGATLEGVLEVDGHLRVAPGSRVTWVRARGTLHLEEGATVARGAHCGRLHLVAGRRNAPVSSESQE